MSTICRRRSGRVEASRSELQYGLNLLARNVKPVHDFLDAGSCFQILKHCSDWHPCVSKNSRAAALAWDALHRWAL